MTELMKCHEPIDHDKQQEEIFQILDTDWLINRIGGELLDMIAEKHPEWIDAKAMELLEEEED